MPQLTGNYLQQLLDKTKNFLSQLPGIIKEKGASKDAESSREIIPSEAKTIRSKRRSLPPKNDMSLVEEFQKSVKGPAKKK